MAAVSLVHIPRYGSAERRERKLVSVLFVDATEAITLDETLDPEDIRVRARLAACLERKRLRDQEID